MHKKNIKAQTESTQARNEMFLGQQYLVVPVIAMVEGVRFGANADGGELGVTSEFGKFPGGWDGRPLVVNHPKIDDEFVSANSPDVLEDFSFGMTANTYLDENKLKMEAWINLERASMVRGAQEFVDSINANDVVEVSVGFFTDLEKESGTFAGKDFIGIWRNIVPDHLALLPSGVIGACSIEDGCGVPRINGENEMPIVVDEKNTPCCESCASQDDDLAVNAQDKLLDRIIAQAIPDNMLDTNIRDALTNKLRENYSEMTYLWGFTKNHAVFEVYDNGLNSYKMKRIEFMMDDDGNVSMPNPPEEVSLITRIVTNAESSEIDNQSKYDDGENQESDDSRTNSNETNETEKVMSDEVKDQTEDEVDTQSEDEETTTQAEDEVDTQAEDDKKAPTANSKALSVNEFISQAPDEMKEMLESGMRMHTARKSEIISVLKKSGRCKFDDTYLNGQSLNDLENLAELANVPSFAGKAAPILEVQEDNSVPAAPVAFPTTKN